MWVRHYGFRRGAVGRRWITIDTSRVAIALARQRSIGAKLSEAAREALRGPGFDMLLVLGFAFDASAVTAAEEFHPDGSGDFAAVQEERRLGRLPVLIVGMNADLAMGAALK